MNAHPALPKTDRAECVRRKKAYLLLRRVCSIRAKAPIEGVVGDFSVSHPRLIFDNSVWAAGVAPGGSCGHEKAPPKTGRAGVCWIGKELPSPAPGG